jgi:DNA-binding HxlR family transcriptional regulator
MTVVRRTSFEGVNCSIAQCLEVIGDWWSPLILRDAMFGVTRFDDFQSRLGISRNILTDRLDHLVARGVLERQQDPQHARRWDYRLTDRGRDLWIVLTAMREWGDRWAAPDGPPVAMRHDSCEHTATMVPACSHCGSQLRPGEIHPEPGSGATDPHFIPRRD